LDDIRKKLDALGPKIYMRASYKDLWLANVPKENEEHISFDLSGLSIHSAAFVAVATRRAMLALRQRGQRPLDARFVAGAILHGALFMTQLQDDIMDGEKNPTVSTIRLAQVRRGIKDLESFIEVWFSEDSTKPKRRGK